MCYGDAEQAGQEGTVGSVDKRWTSTTRLRRVQGGVLITFLGFQQTALHSSDLGRGLQLTAAVLAGCSFFAMLAIGWTLLMRCVDERRKAVLQRSVLIGVAITMGIACVAGYLELALRRTFHVPLLALPACLVLMTALAKVMMLSHRRWLGLGPRAQ